MAFIAEECGHFIVLPLVVGIEWMVVALGAGDMCAMKIKHDIGKPVGEIAVLTKLPGHTVALEDIAGLGQHLENQPVKGQVIVELLLEPCPEIEQLHVLVVRLILHFTPEIELMHAVFTGLEKLVDELPFLFHKAEAGKGAFAGRRHFHEVLELKDRGITPDDLQVDAAQQGLRRGRR